MNAHPSSSEDGKFAVVTQRYHRKLHAFKRGTHRKKGYHFKSETDTEVVAHLLEDKYDGDLGKYQFAACSIVLMVRMLEIICADEPDKIICTKKKTHWLSALAKGKTSLPPIFQQSLTTRDTYILSDGELAIVTRDNVSVFDREGNTIDKEVFHVN